MTWTATLIACYSILWLLLGALLTISCFVARFITIITVGIASVLSRRDLCPNVLRWARGVERTLKTILAEMAVYAAITTVYIRFFGLRWAGVVVVGSLVGRVFKTFCCPVAILTTVGTYSKSYTTSAGSLVLIGITVQCRMAREATTVTL